MKQVRSIATPRLPADPAAFVAEAERITNERDVDAAIKAYASSDGGASNRSETREVPP